MLHFFEETIHGFVHDKEARKRRTFERRNPSASVLAEAQSKGYGVFFTPNGIGEVVNPEGTLLRWDGNVTKLNACFADFDKGSKKEQMEKIRSMELPPSLIVESKRGYHTYWFLKDKEVTKERISLWRRVQTSIAEKFGGDTACSNPSRLMRLPGSQHLKGEPFLVVVVEARAVEYTLSELEVAFPPKPRPMYVAPRSDGARAVYLPPMMCLTEGERHPTLKSVAGRTYRGVASRDFPLVRQALKTWYSFSCVNLKKDWEEEVDDVCAWIEAREAGVV